jgi:formylglycine-generating enzyme
MDTSGFKVFDPLKCNDAWLNTAPVGSLRPNAFGIYDMIGNVAEWIDGCHDAPCTRRLAKGGSWGTLAHNLRIAERFPDVPTHRDDSIGIRVAKTLR